MPILEKEISLMRIRKLTVTEIDTHINGLDFLLIKFKRDQKSG
jgi:hypothetical protein